MALSYYNKILLFRSLSNLTQNEFHYLKRTIDQKRWGEEKKAYYNQKANDLM
jgi:hypothetical protein